MMTTQTNSINNTRNILPKIWHALKPNCIEKYSFVWLKWQCRFNLIRVQKIKTQLQITTNFRSVNKQDILTMTVIQNIPTMAEGNQISGEHTNLKRTWPRASRTFLKTSQTLFLILEKFVIFSKIFKRYFKDVQKSST